jgi:hypothetical protein
MRRDKIRRAEVRREILTPACRFEAANRISAKADRDGIPTCTV